MSLSPSTTSITWPSSCPTLDPSTPSSRSSSRAQVRAGEPPWCCGSATSAPLHLPPPPVHYGSWFDHVKGWLGQRQLLDIFYVTYEELHQVSPGVSLSPSLSPWLPWSDCPPRCRTCVAPHSGSAPFWAAHWNRRHWQPWSSTAASPPCATMPWPTTPSSPLRSWTTARDAS